METQSQFQRGMFPRGSEWTGRRSSIRVMSLTLSLSIVIPPVKVNAIPNAIDSDLMTGKTGTDADGRCLHPRQLSLGK